jgi:uncharacterized damage-inducible protein DinB
MKQYLIETFHYNNWANKQVLKLIGNLTQPAEATRFVSHLINSQNKWMARINGDENAPKMQWFSPIYPLEELERRWDESLAVWLTFLEQLPEEELERRIRFVAADGKSYSALIREIVLQLNYHSIHHRAQISLLLRQQGLEPPFIDYIGTVWQKH